MAAYRRVFDSRHLQRTGISSRTLRSVIEYGLLLLFLLKTCLRYIEVLGSQPAGDGNHKPGGRLPLLSARPAVTSATLNRPPTNFAACEQRHSGCEQFA